MANVAQNVVQFYRGTAAELPASASRNNDSLYFTTDTHRIYLGDHEYADYVAGTGINVTGNVVSIESMQPGDISEIIVPPTVQLPNLGELNDVTVSNAANGQSLVYDEELGEWVNGYSNGVAWGSF